MGRLLANTIVTKPGDFQATVLLEGDEVPDWAVGLVGDHLVVGEPAKVAAPVVAPPEDEPDPVDDDGDGRSASPDESWTVAELRDHAKANDIDLHGATAKADIIAAITGA